MDKATLVVDKHYWNNKIFDLENKLINRDNCMYPFYLLKKEFGNVGIDLSTQDINLISDAKFIIYNDMPNELPKEENIQKSYLLLIESILIRPDNFDTRKHRYFNKIFTWNDDLVDESKYYKINYSYKIPNLVLRSDKKKLCTLISANKRNYDKRELYTERLKTIEWFEANAPDDFSFYGFGWDKYCFAPPLSKLNRFNILKKLFAKKYKTYKGIVELKESVFSEYKFSICYENVSGINGYITEKIFDSLFAGCVPVYLGAPNISDFVPQDCFIDRRNFKNIEELYKFMKNITSNEYNNYIDAIDRFVQSNSIKQFSAEEFAKRIVRECIS